MIRIAEKSFLTILTTSDKFSFCSYFAYLPFPSAGPGPAVGGAGVVVVVVVGAGVVVTVTPE